MNNINQKKLTLGILLVGVIMLSIGFAAYTASLTIKSTATVTPDSSNFRVVFSKSNTSVDTSDVTVDSTSTTTGTAATISGTTISNLSANFTAPNQKAIYKFYAYNDGAYTAHLNSITFLGNKTCTAKTDVTKELLDNACNSIKMTVQVGNVTTEITKQNITGEPIDPKEAALVTVTLEYINGGAYADGNFTVNFSDVSLYYATAPGINEEVIMPSTTKVCKVTNDIADETFGNTVGTIGVGDMVTCGTGEAAQSFYVIPNDEVSHESAVEGTVSLLAQYNLDVGYIFTPNDDGGDQGTITGTIENPTGIQSEQVKGMVLDENGSWKHDYYGVVVFDYYSEEKTYGYYETDEGLKPEYDDGRKYPFVYDRNSNLYSYVDNYKTYLKGLNVNVLEATVPSYYQLDAFGCYSNFTCSQAHSWIYSTSYWTGSYLNESGYIMQLYSFSPWDIDIVDDYIPIGFLYDDNPDIEFIGVRPVIIMNQSEIEL